MKRFGNLKKLVIGLTLTSSFLVLAHSVLSNAKFYQLNFISEDEVTFESNINEERFIASTEPKKVKRPSFYKIKTGSKYNVEKNNWEIMRITDSNGKISYDKRLDDDQNSKIIVKLKKINTFKFRLNSDKSLDYYVSNQTKSTLALFHKLNNRYEILELKKIKKEKITIVSTKKKTTKKQKAKGIIFDSDSQLIAFSAVDPSRNRRALLSSQISGSIEVVDGEVEVSDIILHKGTNIETQSVSFSARVLDGGVVRYTDDATGLQASAILMNNGQHGFTMRFTSGGSLGGALVNFFTPDEIDKKTRLAEIQREKNQELQKQRPVSESKRVIASDNQNEDQADNQNNNSKKQTQGFEF